jgi:exopolysaccharide biosynthesis protein
MKKYSRQLVISVFLFLIFYVYVKSPFFLKTKSQQDTFVASQTNHQTNEEDNKQSEDNFEVKWIKVTDPKKLSLFSNTSLKQSSNKFIKTNSCEAIISGGFYTKEFSHIGLLISEFKKISKSQDSVFFNGYVSVSKENETSISKYEQLNSRISLQSGPFIILDSKPQTINLTSDDSARRIVVASTPKKSEIIFMAIYDKVNNLFGPTLSELPKIIEKISKENNLDITNALNLDGGSHSAFLTESTQIYEAQTVGSFFCISK